MDHQWGKNTNPLSRSPICDQKKETGSRLRDPRDRDRDHNKGKSSSPSSLVALFPFPGAADPAPQSSSCDEIKSLTPSVSKSSLVPKLASKLQVLSPAYQSESLAPAPGTSVTPSPSPTSSQISRSSMDHLLSLSDQPLNLSSKAKRKAAENRLMTAVNFTLLENESKFFSSLKERLREAVAVAGNVPDDSPAFTTSSNRESHSLSCSYSDSSPLDLSKFSKNSSDSSSISTASKIAVASAPTNAPFFTASGRNSTQSKNTKSCAGIAETEYRHKKWQMKRTSNHKAMMITRNEPLASDASIHSSGSEGNHLLMSTDSLDSPNGTSPLIQIPEVLKLLFRAKGRERGKEIHRIFLCHRSERMSV